MEEQNQAAEPKDEQQTPQKTGNKSPLLKKFIGPVIALFIVAGAGYWAVSTGKVDVGNFRLPDMAQEALVAKVNGEGIQKKLFDTRFEQVKTAQGIPPENIEAAETLRQQVLEDMISETLLVQYGKKQGIEASQDAVENNYQQIVSQFESEQEFESQLVSQGVTADDVRLAISQDIILQQVVEKQAADNNVQVSEEEMQKVYDDAAAQEGADLPEFGEVKGEIEQYVRQQKIGQLMQDLITRLRTEASIEIVS